MGELHTAERFPARANRLRKDVFPASALRRPLAHIRPQVVHLQRSGGGLRWSPHKQPPLSSRGWESQFRAPKTNATAQPRSGTRTDWYHVHHGSYRHSYRSVEREPGTEGWVMASRTRTRTRALWVTLRDLLSPHIAPVRLREWPLEARIIWRAVRSGCYDGCPQCGCIHPWAGPRAMPCDPPPTMRAVKERLCGRTW